MPAPIALFCYRRPEHLARTLDTLRENPEAAATTIYVFADAARDEAAKPGVDAVRSMLRDLDGFGAVHVVLRETNCGLARNITTGVSDVLSRHESVIVVEDDLLVSPFFLRFMNEALVHYRDEPRVGSVSGYCYPAATPVPQTFFIRGADCWGWATWRDRWQYFEPDGQALLEQLQARGLAHAFDFDGTMGFVRMLEDQIAGKNDSWAVRWHASCFLRDLLILYPGSSLVQNIGQDGSGTHSTESSDGSHFGMLSPVAIPVGGIAIEESAGGHEAFRNFFKQAEPQGSTLRRIGGLLRRVVRKMIGRRASAA